MGDKVWVKCRECEAEMVEGLLPEAAALYAEEIKKQTGVERQTTLVLSRNIWLPPPPSPSYLGATCIGGVKLACQRGYIVINNTLDERVALEMENDKPSIRQRLFP